MPRKPRIDAPGLLYHVIARGIEHGEIFKDDEDRNFFISRLGDIVQETDTRLYAFALIPNHFHLLLRRVKTPISTVMRRLLTGYALYFNKKHKRSGHLFQNRYKSIICQEDIYLLELIRYIHLNPLRAGIIQTVNELEKYPFSGHSYLLGDKKSDWYDRDDVLINFSSTEKKAKNIYRRFIAEGIEKGSRPEFVGGGLKRSLGLPRNYPKTKTAFDDRVLGGGSFVETLLDLEEKPPVLNENHEIDKLVDTVANRYGLTVEELKGKIRTRNVSDARAFLAFEMTKKLGLSGSQIAKELSLSRSAVHKMIKKKKSLQSETTSP